MTVKDLLEVIDTNKSGNRYLVIQENNFDNIINTSSYMLDAISEVKVDAVDIKDGRIRLYINQECIDRLYKESVE